MRIFLLWYSREKRDALDPQIVSARLQKLFSEVFNTSLNSRILNIPPVSVVLLQLPVKGWKAPFYEEDEDGWAFAAEYPMNVRSALSGADFATRNVLLSLGWELQRDPSATLKHLAPPFSLVWSSKESKETFVQNDALGQAQLFETQQDDFYAISNKCMAFSALESPLKVDLEQWATRCTLGWFPLYSTGFQDISFVKPGTQIRFTKNGISRQTNDVLNDWLQPGTLSKNECLELARNSLLEFIQNVSPNCEKPSVGLSGGWDSRAVVSCMRYKNMDFSARVRGLADRKDVPIAQELARIGHFEIRHKASGGLPPDESISCRRSISLALLWQGGAMVTHKHKSFLSNQKHLDGGVVNFMGQHGEIGRAFYAKLIHASELDEAKYETELLAKLTKKMPCMNSMHWESVNETIRSAYRQADRYGLTGLLGLDFFYLYERTRRWASGSLNSQTGVVIAPFLNPDYIRATFAYPLSKEDNPFHRYIIQLNSPEWIDVPYVKEVDADRNHVAETGWKRASKREHYDPEQYWHTVGRPILENAISNSNLASKVFDFYPVERLFRNVPDDLAMIYLLEETLSRL